MLPLFPMFHVYLDALFEKWMRRHGHEAACDGVRLSNAALQPESFASREANLDDCIDRSRAGATRSAAPRLAPTSLVVPSWYGAAAAPVLAARPRGDAPPSGPPKGDGRASCVCSASRRVCGDALWPELSDDVPEPEGPLRRGVRLRARVSKCVCLCLVGLRGPIGPWAGCSDC